MILFIHPKFINYNLYDSSVDDLICRDDFDINQFIYHKNIYASMWIHSKLHAIEYFNHMILFDPNNEIPQFHDMFREVTSSQKHCSENVAYVLEVTPILISFLGFLNDLALGKKPQYTISSDLKEGFDVTSDGIAVSPLQDIVLKSFIKSMDGKRWAHCMPTAGKTTLIDANYRGKNGEEFLDSDDYNKDDLLSGKVSWTSDQVLLSNYYGHDMEQQYGKPIVAVLVEPELAFKRNEQRKAKRIALSTFRTLFDNAMDYYKGKNFDKVVILSEKHIALMSVLNSYL